MEEGEGGRGGFLTNYFEARPVYEPGKGVQRDAITIIASHGREEGAVGRVYGREGERERERVRDDIHVSYMYIYAHRASSKDEGDRGGRKTG